MRPARQVGRPAQRQRPCQRQRQRDVGQERLPPAWNAASHTFSIQHAMSARRYCKAKRGNVQNEQGQAHALPTRLALQQRRGWYFIFFLLFFFRSASEKRTTRRR